MSDLETIIQKLVRKELQEQMPAIIARALAADRDASKQATTLAFEPDERVSVAEAARAVGRHAVTIRRALEARELHGYQSRKGGRWSIWRKCLLDWSEGRSCTHVGD